MADPLKYFCNPNGWIEAYADELFRFAYFRVNNHEQAEDLVQETFLSALSNLKNFRQDCSEKTWLYNILKNKIIDYYRKNDSFRHRQAEIQNEIPNDEFFDHFFKNNIPADRHWNIAAAPSEWELPADDLVLKAEFMQILQACLSLLPETQADAFRLRNIDEMKSADICKELGISPSNFWVLIHRAKLQLRECVEKNWQRYE